MATQNYFKAKNGLEAPSQSTIAVTDSNFPTVRPTLNLDFAGSESVDSRVTFTRASAATYFGADGKLKYAVQNEPRIEYDPVTGECKGLLIEEQRTNVAIGNSALVASAGTEGLYLVPLSAVAPDGTMSASQLYETELNGYHRINFSSSFSTGNNTFSVYVKEINAGGRIGLQFITSTDNIYSGLRYITSGIPVGNGWYRHTYTANVTTAGGTLYVYFSKNDLVTNNYQGTAGSYGFMIWGAQCESGTFSTSYIPIASTFSSRASSATYFDNTGVLRIAGLNQARYGYKLDTASNKWLPQGLIHESSNGNYLKNSVNFSSSTWNYSSSNVISSQVTAPDGKTTGNKLHNVGTSQQCRLSFDNQVTLSAGWWTFSTFAKAGEYNYAGLTMYTGTYYKATFDLTTGAANYVTNCIASSEYVGNGWWRISISANISGDVLDANQASGIWAHATNIDASTAENANGTNGIYIWGAQLETGYSTSSYIYTDAATVTRAADVISSAATTRNKDVVRINNVSTSSWFNSDEGTMAVEFDTPSLTSSGTWIIAELSAGNDNNRYSMLRAANGEAWFFASANGTTQASITGVGSTPANTKMKYSATYKLNDFSATLNGVTPAVDGTGSLAQGINSLTLGINAYEANQSNFHISKFAYYSKKLSNAQLQALTA